MKSSRGVLHATVDKFRQEVTLGNVDIWTGPRPKLVAKKKGVAHARWTSSGPNCKRVGHMSRQLWQLLFGFDSPDRGTCVELVASADVSRPAAAEVVQVHDQMAEQFAQDMADVQR